MRGAVFQAAQIERLEKLKAAWLDAPQRDYSGRRPAQIIEAERRRRNISVSAAEFLIAEDCEMCEALAAELVTPGSWHLDGCNPDEGFAFSFCKTREEFEAQQSEWEQFYEEFEREHQAGKDDGMLDQSLIDLGDETPF